MQGSCICFTSYETSREGSRESRGKAGEERWGKLESRERRNRGGGGDEAVGGAGGVEVREEGNGGEGIDGNGRERKLLTYLLCYVYISNVIYVN